MKLKLNTLLARSILALSLSINTVACAADSSGAPAAGANVPAVNQPAPAEGEIARGDQEQLSQVLERRLESGSVIEGSLIKNRYRQEPYEANYEVQVPYQDTETYYVDIPYQTTETYYENVPYTEREEYIDHEQQCEQQYKCHNEPRESCSYENVCHTVPDRECRQERVCRPVPGQQECEMVEECGTNAHGERICKTRKVCHNGPGSEDCDYVEKCSNSSKQECRQERQCHTTNEQECGYDNVCHSVPVTRYREVTKYRQELRTRTVTKYRQEERTREVTKYRTEERCCVTKYKDVLDHQDALRVVIQFPETSVLQAGEVEKIQIDLIDNETGLDVDLKILSTITNYKVVSKVIQAGVATLTLEEIPVLINVNLMGEKSLTGLKLKIMEDGTAIIVFADKGQLGRTQTVYEIQVKDKSGMEEFKSTVTANGLVEQKMTLDKKLSLSKVHVVNLKTTRQGPGIANPISFLKSFTRE